MLDFAAVRNQAKSFAELFAPLTKTDLRDLTNEMVDRMLELIAAATDADVIFVPDARNPDPPTNNDSSAIDDAEVEIPWSLAHIIVHTTATSEGAAFTAAEIGRGVEPHGPSRYEVPWERVATIAQCRARLEESRRMRLATLEVWPDAPHLDLRCRLWPSGPEVNAIGAFALGLGHDDSHLAQIEETVRMALAAREGI